MRPAGGVTKIDNPPAVAGGVDLYFTDSASRQQLAASFAEQGAAQLMWDVAVRWQQPASEITISWPNIDQLPRRYTAILRDLDGGVTVNLRTQPGYRFTGAQPGLRHFCLEFSTAGEQPVILTNVIARGQRGAGQVIFALSKSANCDIKVMNIAGRTIRMLAADRTYPAGQNIVAWDGRNATGSAVPSGRYLIQIQAVAEDGSAARGLAAMSLVR